LVHLIFLFLAAAVIFRAWEFSGVIVPLIVIFFFSLASREVKIDDIVIKRWISQNRTEKKGELIYVKIIVRNNKNRIPVLEIVDKIPEECTIEEGSNRWLFELKQGEELTLSYAFKCHKRGRYVLGPIFIRLSDTFHFHSEIHELKIFSTFSVVPSLIKLRHLPIYRQRLLPETGSVPSLIYKGRDFDFQGVRDYQAGDEVRAINWRVTAKFNKLATNEFAFDQAARIFVIFDHTTSSKRLLEESVTAALSISEYLISNRNKIGFLALGNFVEEISASIGKRQLLRINEYLIDTKEAYPINDEVFDLRISRLSHLLPPFSQIFLISPLYNSYIVKFLIESVKRGHEVISVMPTLETIKEEDPSDTKAGEIANALLALDRAYTIRRISNLGIDQIYWYPNGPKFETLKVRRIR
jgi:uncharacterized protein (DUF58 family)